MKISFEVRSFGANSGVDGYYGSFDIADEEIMSAAAAYTAGVMDWVETLKEDDTAGLQRWLLKFVRSFEAAMVEDRAKGEEAEMPIWDEIKPVWEQDKERRKVTSRWL